LESISGDGFGSSMKLRALQAVPPSPSLPRWSDPLRAKVWRTHRSCPLPKVPGTVRQNGEYWKYPGHGMKPGSRRYLHAPTRQSRQPRQIAN